MPGAVLRIRYEGDAQAATTATFGAFRSEAEPVDLADLRPGRYEVTEVTTPPGYQLPTDDHSEVVVGPDGRADYDVTAKAA